MGSLYHANAKTTARIRKEIQDSKETIGQLADRLSLNPKTVAKWKKAGRVHDLKTGPTTPRSKSLTADEESIICEFRRQTQLPLDDVFVSLKDKIPALTRSNLHRTLKRHGLNRLDVQEESSPKRKKQKFAEYDIGYVHIDITEVRVEAGKYYLFVGICRVCKYVYVELHDKMTTEISVNFLQNLIDDVPFKIHRILTDNGIQFTYKLLAEHLRPKDKIHPFDQLCEKHNIKHKLTKFRHPWTNGQVEIMNKKIKAYTVKKYYYETVKILEDHINAFILNYNLKTKLTALKYMSPYDKIKQIYEQSPNLFNFNPNHKTLGLNI